MGHGTPKGANKQDIVSGRRIEARIALRPQAQLSRPPAPSPPNFALSNPSTNRSTPAPFLPLPNPNGSLSLLGCLDLVPIGSPTADRLLSRLVALDLVPMGSTLGPRSRLVALEPARLVLESLPGASFRYRAPAPTARADAEMSGCGTSLLVEVGLRRREGER